MRHRADDLSETFLAPTEPDPDTDRSVLLIVAGRMQGDSLSFQLSARGFEVELADYLAEQLGRRPEFVKSQWDKLPARLSRGDFELVLNGYEWSAEREKMWASTIPYYIYTLQLLARADDDRMCDRLCSERGPIPADRVCRQRAHRNADDRCGHACLGSRPARHRRVRNVIGRPSASRRLMAA